ncbi:MAG: type II toxin-antitoxin system VapC family toxin [Candidatus Poribacteria bacterium]|nr:type II toxin-antitoxin system VapC family toxin [Candidatus Poribacteria bacterium]
MRYLLDTHTLLWFITEDEELSDRARRLILDSNNEIFLSIASLWERAIKVNIGKLALDQPFEQLFPKELHFHKMRILDITVDNLVRLITLPSHHRDPFDRLIIAQALDEKIPIISVDTRFDRYGVNREW